MRREIWRLAALWCLVGCAPADTSTERGRADSSHVLVIHVSGSGAGMVTASTGFTCSTQCRQSVDAPSLRLTASAARGSIFKGWLGACSGASTCDLAMDADRDVTAAFEVDEGSIPPGRLSVALVGAGSGRVVSSPGGIDCPATSCSAAFAEGATLTLSAESNASSAFSGWAGACSGSGACRITVEGDVMVVARFDSALGTAPPPSPTSPPAQCEGLVPGAPGTPLSITTFTGGTCGAGMGDDNGVLGLQSFSKGAIALHIVDPGTAHEIGSAQQSVDHGGFAPMPDGFTGLLWQPDGSRFSAHHWDSSGNYTWASQVLQGRPGFASSPAGGALLIAGDFSWNGWPTRHQAFALSQSGSFLWASDLAARGAVYGMGFDLERKALLITDAGDGHSITAQWLSDRGAPLTGEFLLLADFVAGASTWFETAPLIGGGVGVRRVDQLADADGRTYRTARWLVTVEAGLASAHRAPSWLAARPDTDLAIARRGKAYAALPLGGPGADCAQKIEVLAPDGTSCGFFDATIARGQCRTEDMGFGRDGTPIQLMPKALSPASTCSYRWWRGGLR